MTDNEKFSWKHKALMNESEISKLLKLREQDAAIIAQKDVEISELKNRLSSFKRWDGQPFAATDAVWVEAGRVIKVPKE